MTFYAKYSTLEFVKTIFYLPQCLYCSACNFTPSGFIVFKVLRNSILSAYYFAKQWRTNMGLYENIKKVAALKGYTIYKLEQELRFPRSSISKYNSSDPSVGKIRQIANFLNVSYSSIISGDDDLPYSDHKDITKSLEDIMSKLESVNSGSLMYNGQELSEVSKELLRNALKYAIKETRNENKSKNNPHKNKE